MGSTLAGEFPTGSGDTLRTELQYSKIRTAVHRYRYQTAYPGKTISRWVPQYGRRIPGIGAQWTVLAMKARDRLVQDGHDNFDDYYET